MLNKLHGKCSDSPEPYTLIQLSTRVPMMRNYLTVLLWLLAIAPLAAEAQNSAQDVRAFMEQRDREIKEALQHVDQDDQSRERARSLINDRIDFAEMGRRALGRYDADLTDDQRKDFVETFAAIVRAQSLSDLSVYNAQVTYDSVGVNKDHAYVRTRATLDKAVLAVEYMLHLKEGTWWLYDIVIDDVGTVEGYAISFQTYIRKRGIEPFLESLRKKLSRDTAVG